MDNLMELASRIEASEGADRELDLEIALLFADPEDRLARVIETSKRGLNQRLGQSWELEAKGVQYEVWNEHCCYANGNIPVASYTASLDAAMGLIPEGCGYEVHSEYGDELVASAHTYPLTGRHIARVYTPAHGSYETTAATPALALVASALRARAS